MSDDLGEKELIAESHQLHNDLARINRARQLLSEDKQVQEAQQLCQEQRTRRLERRRAEDELRNQLLMLENEKIQRFRMLQDNDDMLTSMQILGSVVKDPESFKHAVSNAVERNAEQLSLAMSLLQANSGVYIIFANILSSLKQFALHYLL